MYTIQGYGLGTSEADSPFEQATANTQDMDQSQVNSDQTLNQTSPLTKNKEQYYSSQESQIIGNFNKIHLFDQVRKTQSPQ